MGFHLINPSKSANRQKIKSWVSLPIESQKVGCHYQLTTVFVMLCKLFIERRFNELDNILYAVTEDGEKLEGGTYLTPEQSKREEEIKAQRREYFRRQDQANILRINFAEVLGEFYFVNYRKLLDVIDDDTALAFKYLYLCTFADKNGKLEYEGKPVLHKYFKRMLGLKDVHTASVIVDKMEELLLLYSIDGEYYVNLEYYIRNRALPENFKGNSSRMIDRGIRKLYEQATPRYHAMLGKLVPLLEYLNKHNNILCTRDTVDEYDYKRIKPLTATEICSICGRSTENSDYFIKQLRSFTIDRLPFVRRVVDNTKYNLDCYIVNPYVVYMGNHNDHLEWTFKLFDLRSRRH